MYFVLHFYMHGHVRKNVVVKNESNLKAKVTCSTVWLLKWVTRSFPVSVIPHVQTIEESVNKLYKARCCCHLGTFLS